MQEDSEANSPLGVGIVIEPFKQGTGVSCPEPHSHVDEEDTSTLPPTAPPPPRGKEEPRGSIFCDICGHGFRAAQHSRGTEKAKHLFHMHPNVGRTYEGARCLDLPPGKSHFVDIAAFRGQNWRGQLGAWNSREGNPPLAHLRRTCAGEFWAQGSFRCTICEEGKCKRSAAKLLLDRESTKALARLDGEEGFGVEAGLARHTGHRGRGKEDHTGLADKKQGPKRLHPCSECGQAFCSSSALTRHRIAHVQELYKRPESGQSFRDTSAFVRHQKGHIRRKRYRCVKRGQGSLDAAVLMLHQKSRTEDKARGCVESEQSCGSDSDHRTSEEGSPGVASLGEEHSREEVLSGSRQSNPTEGEPFRKPLGLGRHQRTCSNDKVLSIPAEENSSSRGLYFRESSDSASCKPIRVQEKLGHGCRGDGCWGGVESSAEPQRRTRVADKPALVSTEMAALIRLPSTKPYKCHDCKQSFVDAAGLSRHQSGHLKDKHLKCLECAVGFPNRLALIQHQMEHTAEKLEGVQQHQPKNRCGKEGDRGNPLEFGESFTEISAVLLQRGTAVSERGASQRLKDRGVDGKQNSGNISESTEPPYFHLDLRKASGSGGERPHHRAQHDRGKYVAHPKHGKISRNSSILLRHLQNHTAEKP
uniref:Uncharacterized protein n=1 Tax=Sphaerodactylus townsendi TaxID=933632 RepID=A0ACB8EVT4_9SAUR